MAYPIITEVDARNWHRKWSALCLDTSPLSRVAPPEPPAVATVPAGDDLEWDAIAEALVSQLHGLLETADQARFESEGAVLVHRELPDHEALRDPEFWTWLAVIHGRGLIGRYYPFKPQEEAISPPENDEERKPPRVTPAAANFVGSGSRETLFFRFWIRAEMARLLPEEIGGAGGAEHDEYEFVRPGRVDFWRSHVFRQLFAHHRPFLHAFVDFQFPADESGERGAPRLSTPAIRQLAKDLSKSCANIRVELLDRAACAELIRRVWTKTKHAEAWKRSEEASETEGMAAE